MIGETLSEIYQLFYEAFGPQHWWPGENSFEIVTGAILTQNTNWANVEKAIENLKATENLTPDKLHRIDISKLAELIRPAGYYNIKAKRLKNFINWLFDNYDGKMSDLELVDTEQLRAELLSIKGVGRETADSILLYALSRPVFVVDAYTARIVLRHELIDPGADYEQLRELFESNLPEDVRLYNEYHALLVRVGKEFCKPKARCSGCPLEGLPHTLDIEYY
ncbi:MAG: endonuclease III domain-containing protein [Planctomycetota bacterium]|jgi:endonuclease-3 related protein